MRLSLVSAALAALGLVAAVTPAAAGHDAAYFGLRGSYVWTDEGSTQGVLYDYDVEYADGFAVAVYMGWILDDNFRLEAEGGFRSADIDEVTILRDDTAFYSPGDTIGAGDNVQMG